MAFFPLIALFILSPVFALECRFRSHEALGRQVLSQVQNLNCGPGKRIHLTFDDGPHTQYTPLLLAELNRRNVKSTFFVSTTNIAPGRTAQRGIVSTIMDSGHLVASHGHRHEAYDLRLNSSGSPVSTPLTPAQQAEEIALSTRYLNESTGNRYGRQSPLLFRFPYGRGALPSDAELDEMERRGDMRFSSRDRATRLREYRTLSEPLNAVAAQGYGHLLWNHDSGDSGSAAPDNTLASKANFVAGNLRNLCSSGQRDIVSLFHDIKSFNPEAVAVLIDLGQCLGMSFVDAQTILASETLRANGTYITRQSVESAPARQVDSIGDLLRNLGPDCPENTEPAPGSCYSESLDRYFADCESGSVSICIRGSWFRKTDEKLAECRARGL